ncbi:MAG: HNH endonuclease [Bacteroidales bacterium]|nr:HNH endonuclease [Candidatus Liminaster caballi]
MPTKERTYSNFGEFIYWSYANLQMLHYAVSVGKRKYDRTCYMIRSKAFKAYKEGRWNIHDLLEFNVAKIQQNNYCWYCGKEMDSSKLTKDHVFPRSKGGDNDMDNIIMVCKTCNSSKGNMDLFEWYAEVRQEWPPLNVLVHYLKNIYLYAIENDLMDKLSEDLDKMDLPFNWHYIPSNYPQPELYLEENNNND